MNSLTNKMLRTLSTSHCLTDTMTTLKLLHKYWPIPDKQNERWPSSTCLSHYKGTNLTGLSSVVQIFTKQIRTSLFFVCLGFFGFCFLFFFLSCGCFFLNLNTLLNFCQRYGDMKRKENVLFDKEKC